MAGRLPFICVPNHKTFRSSYIDLLQFMRRFADGPLTSRLQQIKRKYDPGNLFRMNQNVPPA